MKHYFNLFLLLSFINPLFSQVKGNGNIASLSQNVPNLRSIDIQFNANIILDYEQDEVLKISADENVLEYISIYFKDGNLLLDQKKWIEPSMQPVIKIGCPNLLSVFQGTHSVTRIINAKGAVLTLQGNVGTIIADGRVDELILETGNTSVNLQSLIIGIVRIKEDCKSRIVLNQYDELVKSKYSKVDIQYMDASKSIDQKEELNINEVVSFIEFRIKNNSKKRNSYYVKGPNGRGGYFSYGFTMLPFASKAETWSVGTIVYEQSRTGKLEELIVITADNEGKNVNLFN